MQLLVTSVPALHIAAHGPSDVDSTVHCRLCLEQEQGDGTLSSPLPGAHLAKHASQTGWSNDA